VTIINNNNNYYNITLYTVKQNHGHNQSQNSTNDH